MNDCFVGRLKDEIPESLEFITKPLIAKNLKKLDLSNNAVSIKGAEAIAPYLSKATSLETLLINNGGMGIDGVTIISKALAVGTPNLEVLA